MQKHALSSVPILEKSFASERRFGFLYAEISAAAIATVMIFSGIAGLAWSQSLLMGIGTCGVGWAVLFTVLEMRRLGNSGGPKEDPDPYPSRTLIVAPPTEDPYPHHEDYVESQGFDQGQLTARLPDALPFLGFRKGAKKS
jgi:hypothetical protein